MTDVVNASVPEFTGGFATNLDSVTTSDGRRSAQSNPCIHASPLPQVINSDGLPANETYTHTNCTNLDWAPNDTVNGDINITDTSSGSTLSYTQTDSNLTLAGNDLSGVAFTEVRNGKRYVSQSASNTVSVTRNVDAVRTLPTHTINITNDWTWNFTATSGNVQLLRPLPAGQFVIPQPGGTVAHSTSATILVIGFYTGVPLQYDPTCATPPAFTGGTIKYTQVGGANPGKFTATFTGCGVPPTITPR